MADSGNLDRPLRFAYLDAFNAGIRGETPRARQLAAHVNLSFDGWAIVIDPRDLFHWGDVVRDDVRVLVKAHDEPIGAKDKHLPRCWIPILARIPREYIGVADRYSDWFDNDVFGITGTGNLGYSSWLFHSIGILPGDTLADLTGYDTGIMREFQLFCEMISATPTHPETRQLLLPFAEESA